MPDILIVFQPKNYEINVFQNCYSQFRGGERELITNWWVFSKVTFMNTFVICSMLLKKKRMREKEKSCWAPGIYFPEC